MNFGGISNLMASGTAETFSSSLTKFETSRLENLFRMCKSNSLDNDREDNAEEVVPIDFSSTMGRIGRPQATLKRNEMLDVFLKDELEESQSRPTKFTAFRENLPVFDGKAEILDRIRRHRVVIISGETGSGKTTQVAQYILDDMIEQGDGSKAKIIVTQPRRISAITVAKRVAEERGEVISQSDGKSVGYQIRHEHCPPRDNGSILFCTTGIVLQWLRTNPLLTDVSHVILDEVHERDMMTDFLIVVIKGLLELRTDLKLILMSASLDESVFSKYFDRSPVVNVPGRTFPVQEVYLDEIIRLVNFPTPSYELESAEDTNLRLVAKLVHHIHTQNPINSGAILVFLTGWDEQDEVSGYLMEGVNSVMESGDAVIHFLHSLVDMREQRAVFDKSPKGVRKIILSTNIGETSITIDDVVYVVDSGKIKMTNFDPLKNLITLKAEWVSRSNAMQRSGRAGRVQRGICYHLFSKTKESNLEPFVKPEMLRIPLEDVVLNISTLGLGKAETFLLKSVSPPTKYSILAAVNLLLKINALKPATGRLDDAPEELTLLGRLLAELPISPMLGKMVVLGAIFSCLDPILSIACILSEKDIFVITGQKRGALTAVRKDFAGECKSDHLMLARIVKMWEEMYQHGVSRNFCKEKCLNERALEAVYKMKQQLVEALRYRGLIGNKTQSNYNSSNEDLIRAIVGAGLYPNVAKVSMIRGKNLSTYPILQTETDHRINIHRRSINANEKDFPSKWLVYYSKIKGAKAIHVHDCSMIDSPIPFLLFGGNKLSAESSFVMSGSRTLSVDNFVSIQFDGHVGAMLVNARLAMDFYLEEKIRNPWATNWSNWNHYDVNLLNGFIRLLTSNKN